jgi:hypothetical protein
MMRVLFMISLPSQQLLWIYEDALFIKPEKTICEARRRDLGCSFCPRYSSVVTSLNETLCDDLVRLCFTDCIAVSACWIAATLNMPWIHFL